MGPDPSCFFLVIHFGYPQMVSAILVLLLLICSALVSGSEVALFSLSPSDFQKENDEFTAKQKILIRLLDRPQRLLATILVANTFINIAIVLLSDHLGDDLFGDIDLVFYEINLQFLLKVVVVTFLILLFGEILPKIYATRKNLQFSKFMAYPLHYMDKGFSIFTIPLERWSNTIIQRLGGKKGNLSVDQLSEALDLTDEKETTQDEQKILEGIVSFGNTDAKQVMCPRLDVFALEFDQSFKAIIPKIMAQGYSRIPVYKDNLDEIKGILYVKDLLPHLEKIDFKWQNLLRAAYFVPENKKLDDLLNEFKDKKNHLAIIVDEYGGTSGLLTMEDIMEEIVGEISDEFDEDNLIYSKMDENTYILDGKTSLVDFYKIVDIEDPSDFEKRKGDSETIAGFLLEIAGNFPRKNDIIHFKDYTFKVEFMDQKRIKQVKFSKE